MHLFPQPLIRRLLSATRRHFSLGLLAGMLGLPVAAAHAQVPSTVAPVTVAPRGMLLEGSQFPVDAGFDVIDWNLDGKPDLFLHDTGSTGKGQIVLREGDLTSARFLPSFSQQFNCTETLPQTIEHNAARTWCDLNHDGLQDLILFDGQLRYLPNKGTRTRPFWWDLYGKAPNFFPGSDRMVRENARYVTGPETMYWNKGIFARQVLTLTAADWDGDGLQDLLVCRFKDEAPGVTPLGELEQWTAWGRRGLRVPQIPGAETPDPKYLAPLDAAPPRGFYFYRNQGTAAEPHLDQGTEILTADGASIDAPNPVAFDVDGDGVLDIVSSETAYRCNAFRVDWPTVPHVQWFRRPAAAQTAVLAAAQPVRNGKGQPIPAGTMARLADFRGSGQPDLLVMDSRDQGTIRWYRNAARAGQAVQLGQAEVIHGREFLRFDFMAQPLIVDWFGPNSRDLILHGNTDPHCKWALRRTALYRNTTSGPGQPQYELAGYLSYRGDLALVPVAEEERHYDVYGTAVALAPVDGSGRRSLMMSVGGRLYHFTDFDARTLTFDTMRKIDLPGESNRHKGLQEIAVNVPFDVKHIRISNESNGLGNLRDSFLHVQSFQALAGGKNVATADRVQIKKLNKETVRWYQVQNPLAMFTPGTRPGKTELGVTSWGYFIGPAVSTLDQPAKLEQIRFEFAARDGLWYDHLAPFRWQGKVYRMGMEEGEPWYQYKVEVSANEQDWTVVADRLTTDRLYSHPRLVDWNADGRVDLLLGVTSSLGIWPAVKSYHLYLNTGTSEAPRFSQPITAVDEAGRPQYYLHLACKTGIARAAPSVWGLRVTLDLRIGLQFALWWSMRPGPGVVLCFGLRNEEFNDGCGSAAQT